MRSRRESGTVLPLVALTLAVLMGFGGMAVDVGYWEYNQRQQQNAADAAAIGGAQQELYTTCGTGSSSIRTAAQNDATKNGYTDDSGVTTTVAVNNPPASPNPFSGDSCAVDVQITKTNVPTWFTQFLGQGPGIKETTEAVATLSSAGPCIWALTTSQQNDFSNTTMVAPKCSIVMNTNANFSNSSVEAAYIGYASGTNNISGASFPEATPSAMLPVADPCPEMPGCAYLAAHPPSVAGCSAVVNNPASGSINQGCYAQFQLGGTSYTMCGTYVINGSFHVNNATVTSTCGTTIYLTTAAADTNYSNSHLTLTAPTSGNYIGVVLYRPGAQSSAVDMSTCTCVWNGLVYFPTSKVNLSNTGNGYTILVVGQTNISNAHSLDFSTPPPGTGIGRKVVLAQ